MPLLISIDPGLSTGVAVFEDGHFVHSYTDHAPYARLRDNLQNLTWWKDEIVCEQGPTNHRRQAGACIPVEALVNQASAKVTWVRPTEWKGTPQAVLQETDVPGSKHEKDATCMARWHLARVDNAAA